MMKGVCARTYAASSANLGTPGRTECRPQRRIHAKLQVPSPCLGTTVLIRAQLSTAFRFRSRTMDRATGLAKDSDREKVESELRSLFVLRRAPSRSMGNVYARPKNRSVKLA